MALAFASVAFAAGDLTQKAGTAGCVSESGTGGECQDGRGIAGAAAVALSPDGENAYAASSSGDGVAVLSRDLLSGKLFPIVGTAGCLSLTGNGGECHVARELDAADDVAVSPDGKSVYVAAPFDDAIAVFSRSPATGELTQLAGADGCVNESASDGCADGRALDGATSVVVSPDSKDVYVASAGANGGIAIFERNTTSGALTQMAGIAGCIDEDGSDGCADGDEQVLGAQNVEITPDGKAVYAAAQTRNAVTVYDRNSSTGELGQKAGAAGCINETGSGGCQDGTALLQADSLAISPNGQNVYVASKLSDAIAVFDRNTGNNELTQKAGSAGCISETGRSDPAAPATAGTCQDGVGLDGVTSVAVLPGGEAVYGAARESSALTIFARDTGSGALTQKTGTAGCISETGTSGACQDGRALSILNHVVASSDGDYVYAAAAGSSAISIFDVDAPPPAGEEPSVTEQPPADPGGGSSASTTGSAPAVVPPASAPRVVKGKGPKAVVKTRKAKATVSFGFSSPDPAATFQCKLDRGPFKACKSPAVATASLGAHTFTVQASAPGGTSAPATFGFAVKKQKPKRK